MEGAGVPETLLMRPELLDATVSSYDENARLRPLTPVRVTKGALLTNVDLDAYGIAFWSFEPRSSSKALLQLRRVRCPRPLPAAANSF